MAVSGKRRARDAKKQRRRAREKAQKAAQQYSVKPWSSTKEDLMGDLEAFVKLIEGDGLVVPEYQKEIMLALALPEGAVGATVYQHPNTKYAFQVIDEIEEMDEKTMHVGVDLPAPNSSSWTKMGHALGKHIHNITPDGMQYYYGDLGVTTEDGITMTRDWYLEPLNPNYTSSPEDVMLPEQDRIVDRRGILHVEL